MFKLRLKLSALILLFSLGTTNFLSAPTLPDWVKTPKGVKALVKWFKAPQIQSWLKSSAGRKAIQIATETATAWGFGAQDPIGYPNIYASIRLAEDTNDYTFKSLNKAIPILFLIALTYGAGVGFQYLDFDLLGPATGYATGLGLPIGYLSYEQLDSWLQQFKKGELSWQKADEDFVDVEAGEGTYRPEGETDGAGGGPADEPDDDGMVEINIVGDENV